MSTPFYLKPPVLVGAIVLIALLGLTNGLKRQNDRDTARDRVERTDVDRLETGKTRVGRINAPSASVSSASRQTGNRAPAAPRTQPREQLVEDFAAAQRRADGNSHISGRIVSMPELDEEGGRRPWERGEGERAEGEDDRRRRFEDFMSRMQPVEGAEVMLFENDPNTTHPPVRVATTNSSGTFTLPNLNDADQRYILVAKAKDLAPEAISITLNERPREDVFLRLSKGVPVSGQVIDAETSEPVGGATVYQPNARFEAFSALGVTTTTANGEFHFANVDPRAMMTQARADGYTPSRARVRAPSDDLTIRMRPGVATISGVTLDRLTGKPQGGARVWVRGRRDLAESVVSSDDGTFRITNLPEGEVEVYAVRGMESEPVTLTLERGKDVEDVELLLPTMLQVSGQVLHATERKPLEGIKVWYNSSKGAQHRTTNSDGRFAFETMAIDSYEILINEKGYLPIQDGDSTNTALQTIARKVAKNQSSDELTIRLRPVPTIEGTVTGQQGRGGRGGGFGGFGGGGGGGDQRIHDAEVKLSFVADRHFEELKTRTDAAGNFFFNLPDQNRGDGIVVATKDMSIATEEIKLPTDKSIDLKLERNFVSAQLYLIDETALDSVSVDVSVRIPKGRGGEHSDLARDVKISEMNSMRGGRMFGMLPADQDVTLTFHMPDGKAISEDFPSSRLLNSQTIFVYDPVSESIIVDTTPRSNRGGDRGWGGRGGGGRGQGGPGGGQRGPGGGPGGPGGGQGGPGGGGWRGGGPN